MFKVIKHFTDLQDNSFAYHVGDTYPREGFEVSPERLDELSTDKNRRGIPLIEEIPFSEPQTLTEDVPEEKPKAKRGKKKG